MTGASTPQAFGPTLAVTSIETGARKLRESLG